MQQSVSSKVLLKARRMAKRNRTSVACARCKMAKSKCAEYRPCKRCVRSREECKPAVKRSTTKVSSHASSNIPQHVESYHDNTFRSTYGIHDVPSTPTITTLEAACDQINPTASFVFANAGGQHIGFGFQRESFTNSGAANQLHLSGQLPAIQNYDFMGIHSSQHFSHVHSSRTSHFGCELSRVSDVTRRKGFPWTQSTPQHPTLSLPFLPVMQSTPSPAALIPPAAMALLSAWATPPPPTLAPLNHLLPAFPLLPPAVYFLRP
jgi:hypothetical protein